MAERRWVVCQTCDELTHRCECGERDPVIVGVVPDALSIADDLLRRLAEWDVMQVTADGAYWKNEIARARAALSGGGLS